MLILALSPMQHCIPVVVTLWELTECGNSCASHQSQPDCGKETEIESITMPSHNTPLSSTSCRNLDELCGESETEHARVRTGHRGPRGRAGARCRSPRAARRGRGRACGPRARGPPGAHPPRAPRPGRLAQHHVSTYDKSKTKIKRRQLLALLCAQSPPPTLYTRTNTPYPAHKQRPLHLRQQT